MAASAGYLLDLISFPLVVVVDTAGVWRAGAFHLDSNAPLLYLLDDENAVHPTNSGTVVGVTADVPPGIHYCYVVCTFDVSYIGRLVVALVDVVVDKEVHWAGGASEPDIEIRGPFFAAVLSAPVCDFARRGGMKERVGSSWVSIRVLGF